MVKHGWDATMLACSGLCFLLLFRGNLTASIEFDTVIR